ncbi:hypothetical protein [Streptomyces sp. NPDC088254]|uniref:hypothetical protein n=1 Tax=Streptomyces sp. NPDC088254 TaxID=3365847 RepID=UPI003823C6A4
MTSTSPATGVTGTVVRVRSPPSTSFGARPAAALRGAESAYRNFFASLGAARMGPKVRA